MNTIIEPFRIKSVEPIHMTSRAERERAVAAAGGNLFNLPSEYVTIDLLTDSGTGAMSSEQWAAMMRGDESYAGAPSFARFEAAVHEVFGFPHVIPTHQGRAAEHLLFDTLAHPGQIVPNNTHFDTTRANIELAGAEALDLPCPESRDLESDAPFKGNMDLARTMFDLADGCTMSAKKDGLANIGGFIACRDEPLAQALRTRLVVTEGFPTYGGLAGRDLEAIAQGLREVVQRDYLEYRFASIRYVCERLRAQRITVLWPLSGGWRPFL